MAQPRNLCGSRGTVNSVEIRSGKILGISGFYHDSAACLLDRGKILAAAQEERFTRKRHDADFPIHSVRFCLERAGCTISDLDAIVFYDKPILTFERLLETYLAFAPKGFRSYISAMPMWLKEKLFQKRNIRKILEKELKDSLKVPILFSEHHLSHAASAFYPSPYKEAAVLCLDGVGEWATTTAWNGRGNNIEPLWEIRFPHSLGLLYSAFTYYTGFKVNSGEYKVMGLAPYGEPKYVQAIYDNLIDLKEDGSFRLNVSFFDYCTGLRMTNSKFDKIFGGPPRKPESTLTQREMDLARSVQVVTEEIVLRLAKRIHRETGHDHLCMAGGVALNCVANGRLRREGPFKGIWVQPAAGDAGGAIGCAMAVWHEMFDQPRTEARDQMNGAFLGPKYSNEEIRSFLESKKVPFQYYPDDQKLFDEVTKDLVAEKVIGWMQGAMEFGPRALGARSILGDARSPQMQSTMNLKVKHRESFRPFAPSVLADKVGDFFEWNEESPYMLMVASVRKERRKNLSQEASKLWGIDLLKVPRSDVPAITHVDYSARIQTVNKETNPRYYNLIKRFEEKTGYPILVNSSFNVRGEPIVCTPEDAFRCFLRTEIDTLVMENIVLRKSELGSFAKEDQFWMKEFELN